jgi:hypothetical protein
MNPPPYFIVNRRSNLSGFREPVYDPIESVYDPKVESFERACVPLRMPLGLCEFATAANTGTIKPRNHGAFVHRGAEIRTRDL